MSRIDNALQAREKQEMAAHSEQTTPGPVFVPAVDIFETDHNITLIADMPGVNPDQLDIDLRENTLTISGDVPAMESDKESEVLREYRTGRYFRRFTLSEVIDQARITADIKDGVLRLSLPKVEKATPRKITVKNS